MKDLSHDAFKDCPYEVDPCLTPSDNVNNDLQRKIDRIHGISMALVDLIVAITIILRANSLVQFTTDMVI